MKMDQEEWITKVLNRGCYSTLWEYLLQNKGTSDRSDGSDTESEQNEAEEIDECDCVTLENILNLQFLPEDED